MDAQIIETGNGGDILLKGNDLSMVYSFENMPYLAMFGGNKEAITETRLEGQQAFDFWGNTLLAPNDKSLQFNSITEKTLENTPLTSVGRMIIEAAIKSDLEFMAPFATVTVTAQIIDTDHLRIAIGIEQPENLERKDYIYIWENGRIRFAGTIYTPNAIVLEELDALQSDLNLLL